MLAIFVQTIVNNKYLGHFVMVLYIVATIALPPAGFQNYLYRFGEAPQVIYSDINGYGPFLQPLIWFRIYWILAAILLAILTNLLWVRGTESSFAGAHGPGCSAVLGGFDGRRIRVRVAMAGVGGYIFYNTHVLNHYQTTFQIDEARAQYEKKYKQYWALPQPRVTDVKTEVDYLPGAARVHDARHHVAGEQDFRSTLSAWRSRFGLWI